MDKHVRAVGLLNAGLGALCIVFCLAVLIICGGPEGVLLISAREGSTVTTTEGFVMACVMVYLLVMAGPLLTVGLGLLRRQGWARDAGVLVSVFTLPIFPLGTLLGIYNLWVLNSHEAEPLFRG